MKKYLVKSIDGSKYSVVDHHSGFNVDNLIEIPEGAEVAIKAYPTSSETHFYRDNGEQCFDHKIKEFVFCKDASKMYLAVFKEAWVDHVVIWERYKSNTLQTPPKETQKDIRVEWFDKFINGVSVQYRVGYEVGKEDSQWNNLTWKSLQVLQHKILEFREKPKYFKLNGIEFKSVEKLMNYIKNNYDLAD